MIAMQIRDSASMPGLQPAQASSNSMPIWVPIVICVALIAIPTSIYVAYVLYNRRPRRVEDKEARPAPSISEIKFSDPFDTRRPSTNKWTLTVPKWNAPVGGIRRGSDGGFPPGTRRIKFPDPTLAASVESLDNKAPPSPAPSTPVYVRYPTPPPAVHVVTLQSDRSYARAI